MQIILSLIKRFLLKWGCRDMRASKRARSLDISNTGRVAFQQPFYNRSEGFKIPHCILSINAFVKGWPEPRILPSYTTAPCQKKSAVRIKRYWNYGNGSITLRTPFVMNSTAIAARIIPITLDTTLVQCSPKIL